METEMGAMIAWAIILAIPVIGLMLSERRVGEVDKHMNGTRNTELSRV